MRTLAQVTDYYKKQANDCPSENALDALKICLHRSEQAQRGNVDDVTREWLGGIIAYAHQAITREAVAV